MDLRYCVWIPGGHELGKELLVVQVEQGGLHCHASTRLHCHASTLLHLINNFYLLAHLFLSINISLSLVKVNTIMLFHLNLMGSIWYRKWSPKKLKCKIF